MYLDFALYLACGSLAGVLSGLFGIGGGIIVVPFLAWIFSLHGFPADSIMIMAVATSLATIVVTSISAAHAHHQRKAVDWPTVGRLAPGILLGSIMGSLIADYLPARWFKLIFACFLLYVAQNMLRESKQRKMSGHRLTRQAFGGAGICIGALSSILGIGGGTLSVPFLVRFGYPIRSAVAISSACGFPIAVAGTATYIFLGQQKTDLPDWTVGYVYLPALVCIILTSVPFAPMGAHLAHQWPTQRLRKSLALCVGLGGCKLLWQVFI